MSTACRSHRDTVRAGTCAGHAARARGAVRKQKALRTAVAVTATGLVSGFVLVAPAGTQARAALNPTVLRGLHLDSTTLKKVQAYDRYRTREETQRERAAEALAFARKQIGKPYRWGADGPSGYDCSGLAMAAWREAGVKIPRVTYAQYRKVKRKVTLKDLEPGDLVFFHGRSHVGIYTGDERFLHAPHSGARVRIDKLGKRRKRQFAGAVRPGAPAYKEWSPSVKELVEKIDRMSSEKRADHKPPDKSRTPEIPPPNDTFTGTTDILPHTSSAGTPPDESRPEPRPRYKADDTQQTPGRPSDPWTAYTGPLDELTAPGHTPR
jgi:cell wall-associated NlpC family hydrolase